MRVLVRFLVPSLLGALVALLPTGPASSEPGGPEFDPDETTWYAFRDQSLDQWSTTWNTYRQAYIPVDLEISTDLPFGYRISSVWMRNTANRSFRLKRNLDNAAYKAYYDDAKADGYRLVEHETYRRDGERQYAGIWIKNTEGFAWASKRGQSSSQLGATMTAYRTAGLMPIDVDVFKSDGEVRYSTVWVASQTSGWDLMRNQKTEPFRNSNNLRRSTHRMANMDAITVDGEQRYTAIWLRNDGGRAAASNWGMTRNEYDNQRALHQDEGLRMTGQGRYLTPAGPRFYAIWRDNSARPEWAFRADVDKRIQDKLALSPHPGVSVSIIQNGVPVYTRGFGKADKANKIWMDSLHIGQIASISKAVAGVLTFKMMERGEVGLNDLTRTWVPAMPAGHTHTLGQLLSNRGCVRHYVKGEDGFDGDSFSSARKAAKEFWDDALLCDPAKTDLYHYSTHGYTLLGAALEKAGGEVVKRLVTSRLSVPYGLGTLTTQRSDGHRMKLYNRRGNHIKDPNNDWKVLGGGLESNSVDLARFGYRLISGEILSAQSMAEMWTKPNEIPDDDDYAYGWTIGRINGNSFVAKTGSNDGVATYLIMLKNAGISIAVLFNSGDGSRRSDEDEVKSKYAQELGLELARLIGPLPS